VLPHAFPFRLAERVEGEAVEVCLTANAVWSRGEAIVGPLLVEAMAQAAMVLLADPEQRQNGLLAGIDGAEFLSAVAAGDRLRATAKLVGKLGALVKLEAALERDGIVVARAGLLLATRS
jgi:3-hydroxymyristoyl/3-hydroxydecanoyl-(acyl carrier protein) dehydratase